MKRIFSLFFAAALLLSLCACKDSSEDAQAEASPLPEAETETPAPDGTPGTGAEPVLSDGAEEDSRLSALFQTNGETVYTSLARAEGLTCLYDILPESVGSVSGFFLTDGGVYAAVKESYYSLEPAALYFFPADGSDPQLLADYVYPGGLFCLAGESLFYESYGEEYLWRLDTASGETECVLEQPVTLLGADGGFIYYAADGGVYRNDSTMAAEALLFEDNGVSRLFAGEDGICVLTYSETGSSMVETRQLDGSLRAQIVLDEYTDAILCRDGRIYAPQTAARAVLVFDLDGNELDSIPLTELGEYCLFHFASEDALFYETTIDGKTQMYRLDLGTLETEALGETLVF